MGRDGLSSPHVPPSAAIRRALGCFLRDWLTSGVAASVRKLTFTQPPPAIDPTPQTDWTRLQAFGKRKKETRRKGAVQGMNKIFG